MMTRRITFAATTLLLIVAVRAGAAPVGSLAEVEGTVEIGRGDAWSPAQVGAAVDVGDALRTGRPGRVRIVFQDESVTVLGDDSHLIVTEHIAEADRGVFRSLMRLVSGKLRTMASEYYKEMGATYQIETVNAVAGVRGTEFIVTAAPNSTEVVGIDGVVAVHAIDDSPRRGVLIAAHELTIVQRGELPTAPRQLTQAGFEQYFEGLGFLGGGGAGATSDPLLAGSLVPEADRALGPSSGAPVSAPRVSEDSVTGPDVSGVVGQPPAAVESLFGRLRVEF